MTGGDGGVPSAIGNWRFHNPVDVRFGSGSLHGMGRCLPSGSTVWLTTRGTIQRGILDSIQGQMGCSCDFDLIDEITSNPEVASLEAWRGRLAERQPKALVALGGGSVMDTAKVLAMMLPAGPGQNLREILEGARPIPDVDPLPVWVIPTVSGSGSEVTPFATLWVAAEGKKFSLGSPRMFPRIAFLDPAHTASVPWDVTIATGLDALSQALESIWSRNASPGSLAFATRAAQTSLRVLGSLAPMNIEAGQRTLLMEASLLSGMAISQTRTALAHAMSYPITARFGLPHGLACSFTLPALLAYNASADDGRLQSLACALGYPGIPEMQNTLTALLRFLGVPQLFRKFVVDYAALYDLAPQMLAPGRADNNLRPATEADIIDLLEKTRTLLHLN